MPLEGVLKRFRKGGYFIHAQIYLKEVKYTADRVAAIGKGKTMEIVVMDVIRSNYLGKNLDNETMDADNRL